MKKRLLLFLLLLAGPCGFAQVNLDTLSVSRNDFCSCVLGDLAFFAGSTSGSDVVDIYNAATATWSVHHLSAMKAAPKCAVVNNRAYFVGSNAVYLDYRDRLVDYYDATTSSWGTDTVPAAVSGFGLLDLEINVRNNQDLVFFLCNIMPTIHPAELIQLNTLSHTWIYDTIPDSLLSDHFTVHGNEALWTTNGNNPVQTLIHFDLNSHSVVDMDTLPSNAISPLLYSAGDKTFIYGGLLPVYYWSMSNMQVYDHSSGTITIENTFLGTDPSVLLYGNQVVFGTNGAYGGTYSFNPGRVYFYNLSNDQITWVSMSQYRMGYGFTAACGNIYLGGGASYMQQNPMVIRDTIDIIDTATYLVTTGQLYSGRQKISGVSVGQDILFAGGKDINQISTPLVEIYPCQTVGMVETSLQEEWQIFPNPASTEIHVKPNGNAAFIICNAMGQQLKSGTVSADDPIISVADLPAGIYFIDLISAEEQQATKIFSIVR